MTALMPHETWMMGRLRALFALLARLTGGDKFAARLATRKHTDKASDAWRRLKGQWLDAYVAVWVALEIAFYVAGPRGLPWLFAIPAIYRLVEITQVFVNGLLFDERRWESDDATARLGKYNVLSAERTVVLHVILFLEIPLLAGVFYFLLRDQFGSIDTTADALAFSIGTLTTLGDPSGAKHDAVGGWRFLPLGEVLYGFLAGVIVLGRVISLLPAIGARDRLQ